MEPIAVERPPRSRRLVVALVGGVVLLAAGAWVVWREAAPADGSAEAGFARDMATHHAQAVDMAFVVRDASPDHRLRALAYDIIVTQSAQRGMFMGWLQQWGLAQASSGPRMQWMGTDHAHHGSSAGDAGAALMPGMASTEELTRLRNSTGTDAEILFLQLMIRHHEGGVLMARAVLARARRPEVVAIARGIDETQVAEITLMREMLAARGAQPLPTLLS